MAGRVKNVVLHFYVSPQIYEMLRKIAAADGRSISAVSRDLVEKGLVAGGYRTGGQDIASLVRETVQEALRPQTERLAAISAKAAQISAAAFFLAAYNGRQTVPEYLKEEYDAVVANARKLGVEYLKLARSGDVDAFLAKSLERIGGDDF